jgi:cell division protease FtsH
MAEALVEFETLSADQLDDIMAGAKPRHPSDTPPAEKSGRGDTQSPIGGPAEES